MGSAPPVVGGEFATASTPSLEGQSGAGLELESTYLKGVFRTRGDEPHIVQIVRRLSALDAWPPRLLLQSNIGVSGMRRHRIELMSARSRDVEMTVSESATQFHAEAIDRAEPLSLTIDATGVRWCEGQLLEVSGGEVLPALEWSILPDDRPTSAMRHASRVFAVTGTFEDVDIDGFVAIDQIHLAPGRQNYVDDPITEGNLTDVWCSWANAYDDGTLEAGQAAFGGDGFGFGLLASGGQALVAERVSGSITSDDEGRPTRVAFDIDGEQWEFVADDRGLPIEPLPGPFRQSEGRFRRAGDDRQPVVWWATPEVPVSGS